MSAVQPLQQSGNSPSASYQLRALQTLVEGRILQRRKAGQVILHLVACPAPDPYSHPTTVEIAHDQVIGQNGDDVRVVAELSGYARSYDKRQDDEYGEGRTVKIKTADLRLKVVRVL